jgi:hypothetical protein
MSKGTMLQYDHPDKVYQEYLPIKYALEKYTKVKSQRSPKQNHKKGAAYG